jgi:hypothetical protein
MQNIVRTRSSKAMESMNNIFLDGWFQTTLWVGMSDMTRTEIWSMTIFDWPIE